MNTALDRLLDKTPVSQSAYWRDLWFHGCVLNRNLLLAPDLETAECLERLFGVELRKAMADVEIRVGQGEVVQPRVRVQPNPSPWKKGYAPTNDRKLYD